MMKHYLSYTVFAHAFLLGTSFLHPSRTRDSSISFPSRLGLAHGEVPTDQTQTASVVAAATEKNSRYVESLITTLQIILDKYILTGSPATRTSVYNMFDQIEAHAQDPELTKR
jgi:hypothetical protein